MSLCRAHMATFPARIESLKIAIKSLEPQVDEIHLVLNEYSEIPTFLGKFKKVIPIMPDEDFKDVGKFWPAPEPDDFVFLVDDDLRYHDRYCDWMIKMATEVGLEKNVVGLHGSIFRKNYGVPTRRRKLFYYSKSLARSICVDELGTGTVLAKGKNIAPLSYMASSQKFVDVRYAKWCFENSLTRICVARPRKLICTIRNNGPSIYETFTSSNPPQIFDETESYAGKSPNLGKKFGRRLSFMETVGLNLQQS